MSVGLYEGININSYDGIDRLDNINGVSIEEIQRRGKDRAYVVSRFLGSEENFKDVLKQDWKTVQDLGLTHLELAEHLKYIEFSAPWKGRKWVSYDTNQIEKNVIGAPNSPIQQTLNILAKTLIGLGIVAIVASIVVAVVVTPFAALGLIPALGLIAFARFGLSNKQYLIITKEKNNGVLKDLFENNNQKQTFNYQIRVTNPTNFTSILITPNSAAYIEKLGFYQGGGTNNPYRIDPIRLVALLTGRYPSTIQKLTEKKIEQLN